MFEFDIFRGTCANGNVFIIFACNIKSSCPEDFIVTILGLDDELASNFIVLARPGSPVCVATLDGPKSITTYLWDDIPRLLQFYGSQKHLSPFKRPYQRILAPKLLIGCL